MPDFSDSTVIQTLPPADPALRTPRLILRPLCNEDVPAFHKLINDWEICRRVPDAPFPYPARQAQEWVEAAALGRALGTTAQFAIIEARSELLVGCVGVRLAKDRQEAELGYWIGREYWRKGFALEAGQRLVDWAFAELSLARITAVVAADNDGSVAVLERLGFVQTGQGHRIFSCRPGEKLPVRHFTLARDVPKSLSDIATSQKANTVLVVAVALIDRDGRILLARRPEGKKMAGLWEFPGGKIEPGETPEAALARELREELGIETDPNDFAPFVFASHAYEAFHLLMPVFLCRRWVGEPQGREGQRLAWVAPQDLAEYPMPAADRPLIPMLRDFL